MHASYAGGLKTYNNQNIKLMAENEMFILYLSAASLGLIHTVLGPDHYIPFIMMGRAGKWSLRKTCRVTVLCGIGHVAGSVLLGLIGIGIGIALYRIEWIESFRGNLAAWLFISFGLIYFAWGVKKAIRSKTQSHFNIDSGVANQMFGQSFQDGNLPGQTNQDEKLHKDIRSGIRDDSPKAESAQKLRKSMSVWILFTIFIFGPCEPLIPLLMYPAAGMSIWSVVTVALVFMFFTVTTMTVIVAAGYAGFRSFRLGLAERYMHAIAGLTLLLCGVGITFLGL